MSSHPKVNKINGNNAAIDPHDILVFGINYYVKDFVSHWINVPHKNKEHITHITHYSAGVEMVNIGMLACMGLLLANRELYDAHCRHLWEIVDFSTYWVHSLHDTWIYVQEQE